MNTPRPERRRRRSGRRPPARSGLQLRPAAGDGWEFVHPRCAQQRREDLEEVDVMLAAGEREIARDELRWLLSGCDEFLEAHRLLGEMALEDGDVPLARGHFGYAYELALRAWRAAGEPQPIAFARPGNRVVFEAGEGLITSLELLDRRKQAAEVAKLLASWDPKDPLALAEHASRLRGDESPGDRQVCPGGS